MENNVVIVSGIRTAIGKFGGSLKDFNPGQLGSIVIKDVLERTDIEKTEVDEVIMGNVLSAGHGQNIARQASLLAGLSEDVPAYAVNKVCGSGLKSVILGAQSIALGESETILAGGIESMSTAPHVIKKSRWGAKMGNMQVIDSMINDGLWDVFCDCHMGNTAENVAEKYGVSREDQDLFAEKSQNKTEKAIKEGKFKKEIVPIEIKQEKGDNIIFEQDEFPRFGTKKETLAKLKPAFKKDGTVTAGNSSGINDGAAAVLLTSDEKAENEGIEILAEIESYGFCGVKPEIMGMGPVKAIQIAIDNAGIDLSDIDLIELNEAFASQSIAVIRELGLENSMDRINVNGGAISLGHPIGASGTRILVTLLHELERIDGDYGLAALCIGGGQGIAMVVKR